MAFSYSFHLSAKSHAVTSIGKVGQVEKHNLRKYKSEKYDRSQIVTIRGTDSLLDEYEEKIAELEKTVDYLNTRMEKFTNRIKDMKKFLKAAKSLDVMQGSLESIGKANLILQQRNNILQSAEEKAESIIEAAKGKSVKMTLQQAKAEADRQNAMRKYEMFMDAHPNIKEQFEKEQRGNHFRSQEHKR